ncbi:MAG: NADP-dependent oxidoreductase [Burkholderiaceae bacterium]|jgi:NADPH:quinone reductase-like Zn-dependent oxidoreductase|nr:NADP-dependent oxidoreductase [Burkholderiaceae bacterium]
MKALVQRAYGPVESSVHVGELPVPAPGSGDVRVRVRFAGINPLDWKLVEGHYKWMSKARPPCGVGFDLAGEVRDVGGAAGSLARGARVAGLIPAFKNPPGAIAQYAIVPAAFLVKVPDAVPLDQAAALPVAGLSALQMCRLAGIERGRRVLVHGASGGVGHLAVQIARNLGAEVTASGSASSQTLLRWLRPALVVDRAAPLANWGGPFDAVLDCATSLTSQQAKALLGAHGHYVSTTPRFPQVIFDTVLNLVRPGKRRALMLKPVAADLEQLMAQLAAGHLRVAIERSFPLADAAQALALSRAGHVRGKVVVAID